MGADTRPISLTLQQIAKALGGEVSGHEVLAPGPGHSPADRSLSVMLSNKNELGFVFNSFANDDPIVCRDYLRQKLAMPEFAPTKRNGSGNGKDFRAIAKATRMAAPALAPAQRSPIGKFPYVDRDKTLLYWIRKYETEPRFDCIQPDGTPKAPERRVLYRWPELIEYPDATVFICEGEKDANTVAALGYCATSVAFGKWTEECVEPLRDRHVYYLEDNDRAGRAKGLSAATKLHGIVASFKRIRLPGLGAGGDVTDWIEDLGHSKEELAAYCEEQPNWDPETETEKPGNGADHDAAETKAPAAPLPFLNIAAWQNQTVPEREWTVRDRIPGRNVTLLSGEGSIGKSILSLQLATAVVLGRDWLQSLPDFGPAIVACCEDDTSEVWRRLDSIFKFYGAAYTDFKDLHVLALAGEETLMATPDTRGLIQLTPLFHRIKEAACDIRPKIIVLDNSADIFGGNENDRAQVRQFIGHLRGLAIASGAGVLLTSHPSLTGITSGTGLSGSTAWNASVRSRLYFKRATTEKGDEPDPDLRVLEVMKSNYGPVGERISLRWKDGLFLPEGGTSSLEKMALQQNAEYLFLDLLDEFERQGRKVSHKASSNNFAPKAFADQPKAKTGGIKRPALVDAMERLFTARKIKVHQYGKASNPHECLARCDTEVT